MSWKALLLKIHGNCSSHVRGYANASVQPDGDVSRHVLPTAAEIAAMDHSNSRVDLLHGQQSGNLRRLSRPSRKSSFDAASLAKLSVSHTGSYSSKPSVGIQHILLPRRIPCRSAYDILNTNKIIF